MFSRRRSTHAVVFLLVVGVLGAGFGSPGLASGDSIVLGFESPDQYRRWEPVIFSGRDTTAYRYEPERRVVCGRAEASASGLALPWPDDRFLQDYPVVEWEWKIDGTVPGGNARTKDGDDYAARVYVNFRRNGSLGWWESAAVSVYERLYGTTVPGSSLNFIWANVLDPGSVVPSPYTDRARLVALESGDDRVGDWVRERVNVRDRYREAFSGEPPEPHSVAIMTDADNTASTVTGCYRRLVLHPPAR